MTLIASGFRRIPIPPTPSIRFGDLKFSGPFLLGLQQWPAYLRPFGGLYAVTVPDDTWKPLPHRPIYFGETEDLPERVCLTHEKLPEWVRAACGQALHFSFYVVIGEQQRKAAEKHLIEHYKPECNKTYNRNAIAARAFYGSLQNTFAPFPRLRELHTLKDLE